MKSILLWLSLLTTFTWAEGVAKVVYDLTTSNLVTFERKILKAIALNSTYYESQLKELHVTVVIHGGAYRFFTKDPTKTLYRNDTNLTQHYRQLQKRIASMHQLYHVEFLMCGAGMSKRKLQAKEILKEVTIIPNATIGLIDRQNEGYAYIPVH